jgi:hypothetical protein
VGYDERPELLASTNAVPMEMRGRPMRGWLRVPSDEVGTARALQRWVGFGTSYVRTLPPKA